MALEGCLYAEQHSHLLLWRCLPMRVLNMEKAKSKQNNERKVIRHSIPIPGSLEISREFRR